MKFNKKGFYDGLGLLLFLVIYISSLLAWAFFFTGAVGFSLAIMDQHGLPLSPIYEILLPLGILVNSVFLTGISAKKSERFVYAFIEWVKEPGRKNEI